MQFEFDSIYLELSKRSVMARRQSEMQGCSSERWKNAVTECAFTMVVKDTPAVRQQVCLYMTMLKNHGRGMPDIHSID